MSNYWRKYICNAPVYLLNSKRYICGSVFTVHVKEKLLVVDADTINDYFFPDGFKMLCSVRKRSAITSLAIMVGNRNVQDRILR